jgi:hypothetical protein
VWSVEFVHPLLVRCAVDYRPKKGEGGPTFRNEFTLIPDGVFSVVRKTSPEAVKWGVTWPLSKTMDDRSSRPDRTRKHRVCGFSNR